MVVKMLQQPWSSPHWCDNSTGSGFNNSAVSKASECEPGAKDLGVKVQDLLGRDALLQGISLTQYVDESAGLGLPTLQDIVKELQKPGLDPRGMAEAVTFDDTVRSINDLQVGMELWGVVTNITNFGAFVDIGVKQDGLVHISQLGHKFVKNPAEAVALSQRVKVRVLEVDRTCKRIQLTMKF